MPTIELSGEECQLLMNRLINSDPLLMKIAAQLREQQQPPEVQRTPPGGGIRIDGNSKEARHE